MRTLAGHTVLVTGGASGIGRAAAKRFVECGSRVVICGRRPDALAEAKRETPSLATIQCDVGREDERERLFELVKRDFPDVNVLVNNAGIQQHVAPLPAPQTWAGHEEELRINLHAPMHLSMLFAPHLAAKPFAAIINVTSGLGFVPMAKLATYSLTKAALHSFTLSLRIQLKDTSVRVIEMAPPAVNTDLGGKGLHDFGAPLNEYMDHAFRRLAAGDEEFGYLFSELGRMGDRKQRDELLSKVNGGVRPPLHSL